MHESLMCHGRTMLYVVESMVICMGTTSVDWRKKGKLICCPSGVKISNKLHRPSSLPLNNDHSLHISYLSRWLLTHLEHLSGNISSFWSCFPAELFWLLCFIFRNSVHFDQRDAENIRLKNILNQTVFKATCWKKCPWCTFYITYSTVCIHHDLLNLKLSKGKTK